MTFFDVIQGEEKYVEKQACDLGGKQCEITITQVMSPPLKDRVSASHLTTKQKSVFLGQHDGEHTRGD